MRKRKLEREKGENLSWVFIWNVSELVELLYINVYLLTDYIKWYLRRLAWNVKWRRNVQQVTFQRLSSCVSRVKFNQFTKSILFSSTWWHPHGLDIEWNIAPSLMIVLFACQTTHSWLFSWMSFKHHTITSTWKWIIVNRRLTWTVSYFQEFGKRKEDICSTLTWDRFLYSFLCFWIKKKEKRLKRLQKLELFHGLKKFFFWSNAVLAIGFPRSFSLLW